MMKHMHPQPCVSSPVHLPLGATSGARNRFTVAIGMVQPGIQLNLGTNKAIAVLLGENQGLETIVNAIQPRICAVIATLLMW